MRKENLYLYSKRFSLSLNRELGSLPGKRSRDVVILRLDIGNQSFYSEASPLSGFSNEKIEDLSPQIELLNKVVRSQQTWDLTKEEDQEKLFSSIKSPSLKFALESILLEHLATDTSIREQSAGIQINAQYLLNCNALISAPLTTQIKNDLTLKISQGFKRIKIKVLPDNFQAIASILNEYKEKLEQNSCMIRLDPNRSLNLNQTFDLIEKTRELPIEYIEEPTLELSHLPNLISRSPTPIALDETARELSINSWITWSGLKHVVVKPTLLGGPFTIARLNTFLKDKGINLTITSSLESDIGLRSIALLCAYIEFDGFAGLDTADIFIDRTGLPLFPSECPQISLSRIKEITLNTTRYAV